VRIVPACRLSALNAIAQPKSALGELALVARIVRLEETLNVTPSFTWDPKARKSACGFINGVFGAAGDHTRMIYTPIPRCLPVPFQRMQSP